MLIVDERVLEFNVVFGDRLKLPQEREAFTCFTGV